MPDYLPFASVLKQRYYIEDKVGEGGFSYTYKAYDKQIDEYVAIKEFFPRQLLRRSEDGIEMLLLNEAKKEILDFALARFMEEVNILNRFASNPTVISIIDFFTENNTAYLVMNYLEGINLQDYLELNGGRIDYVAALQILLKISDVLIEMHAAGILHRDISPDNIYLSQDGQIKLLDFGSASNIDSEFEDEAIFFKEPYSPPEQYDNVLKQGQYTDVYALAATMYQAITGINIPSPSEREGGQDFLEARKIEPSIPLELCLSLKKALELDITKRTPAVKDLQDIWLKLISKNTKLPENVNLPEGIMHNDLELEHRFDIVANKYFGLLKKEFLIIGLFFLFNCLVFLLFLIIGVYYQEVLLTVFLALFILVVDMLIIFGNRQLIIKLFSPNTNSSSNPKQSTQLKNK